MNKGTTIIVVLIAFVGGYFLGSYTGGGKEATAPSVARSSLPSIEEQEAQLGPGNPSSDRTRVLVGPNDAVLGPDDALVTIVEFSDFECGYCKRAASIVHQIHKAYRNEVRIVFKHNPLPFHKGAFPAAEAALAAGEQGKFWEYHDALFENQGKYDRAALESYAQKLKLDMTKFREALDSRKFKAQVEADQAYAARIGARGTPTFFVNGKVVRGAQPFDQFKTVIDQELAHARNLKSQRSVAASAVYTELMREAAVGTPTPQQRPQPQQAAPGQPDPAKHYAVPVGASPVKGKPTAKLTVVEFSSFQCPFCARVQPTLTGLQEKYGDDIRFVFKQHPLPNQPQAGPAAEAALAAHEQGKFFEYKDKVFANMQNLQRPDLERYAEEIGLDMRRFRAALDSGKFKKQIEEEMAVAAQFGVRSTPSFFVNGRPLRGAQPLETFVALADEELAKADKLLASGVPAARLYDEILKTAETKVEAPPAPPPQAARGEPDPNAVYKFEVPADAPSKGAANAKVTIVEIADFQCGFCGRVAPTLAELVKKYPRDVRVVFVNMPLRQSLSAEAAMAAHEQGKFWEYTEVLFANMRAHDRASLERYAADVGLDVAKFKAALDSDRVKARVQQDAALSRRFGVQGTPSFFINGKYVSGALPLEAFEARVKEEIKRADALLARGTRPNQLYAALVKDGLTSVQDAPAGGAPADEQRFEVEVGKSPSKGNPRAAVTIIEFSDFSCPFCSRVKPTIAHLLQDYPNDVRVVFKQLPVVAARRGAELAAPASLAAHEQGKFWEYHDKLFANQNALDRASLERYAQEIGLDMAKFRAALDSGKFTAQIEADRKAAMTAGIGGTPSFLINGRKIVGAQPVEAFKAVIQEELEASKLPQVRAGAGGRRGK
jgi:protein-disulfide isomerase